MKRITRITNMTKAFLIESVKRVPWMLFVLGVLIVIQNIQNANASSYNQTVLLERIAAQSKDIKQLSEDNKKLSQQAVQLANRSAKQVDCVKQLFVDYINTRLYIPQAKADACTVVEGAQPVAQLSEPPKESTPKKQTQPKDNTQTPPAQPQLNFFQRLLKLLKL